MATATEIRHDWWPDGETVLGIWAHPDDEAYLSAGLMARTVRSGGRVLCWHATRGEQGTTEPRTWPPGRLAAHRTRELADSLAVLGVREHAVGTFPDGDCARVPHTRVVPTLVDLIHRTRPDYVLTFGPDGITGHGDHVAVGRWATAAWLRAGHGRLLYAASTRSFLRRHAEVHRRLELLPADPVAIADEQVGLAVRLSDAELDLKRAALAAQASQTAALAAAMGEATYRRWYEVETFRLPAPEDLAAAVGP